MIERIAVAGYRSIRSLVLSLGQLNVVTGANGSGKSNLYRALNLLADVAEGGLFRSLANEGGFGSVRWAGPKRKSKEPVSLRLGFAAEPFSYCLDLGLPIPRQTMFGGDPEIKRECLWRGSQIEARSLCADRRNGVLRCRAERGKWTQIDLPLETGASMLSEFADPITAPELIITRDTIRQWRFYDTFRTDAKSPARQHSIGTYTPVMASDGRDFAAAIQTIIEAGNSIPISRVIDNAFPGSRVRMVSTDVGMQLLLEQPGIQRELTAAELSDGTLRYLLLVAALLTPRPPELMVLNEPENSLHPDLIPALAELIKLAAEKSQIIVVSHNTALVEELESDDICMPVRLEKIGGETVLQDADLLSQYGWTWPSR
ncbi:MAG: AAA family ATPase [Planctomycetota bacterium]